jgi:hypothetical protein
MVTWTSFLPECAHYKNLVGDELSFILFSLTVCQQDIHVLTFPNHFFGAGIEPKHCKSGLEYGSERLSPITRP